MIKEEALENATLENATLENVTLENATLENVFSFFFSFFFPAALVGCDDLHLSAARSPPFLRVMNSRILEFSFIEFIIKCILHILTQRKGKNQKAKT